jgi:hypothetical protein
LGAARVCTQSARLSTIRTMFRKEKDTSSWHYSYALAGYSAPLQCASMGYFSSVPLRLDSSRKLLIQRNYPAARVFLNSQESR